jgi:hypothetical protein
MMDSTSLKPGKARRVVLIGMALIVACAGIAIELAPWKISAARQLKSLLEAQGFQNVRLTVSAFGWHSAALKDITIGQNNPLTLQDVKIAWSPVAVKNGVLDDLTVKGVSVHIKQEADSWSVDGYKSPTASQTPFTLPLGREALQSVPADHIKIEDGQLTIAAKSWQAEAPVQFDLQKAPVPALMLTTEGFRLTRSGLDVAGNAHIDASLKEEGKAWEGHWRITDLKTKSGDNSFPPLAGTGTLKAEADKLSLTGALKSADNLTQFSFASTTYFASGGRSELNIIAASMPWQNGQIAIKNAVIPLGGNVPIHLTLLVHHASVDQLMQAVTGKHVTATGAVSGSIPLIIAAGGAVTVAQGTLTADGPGTIVMPPDAIPGDNPQVETVREILKDFHYSGLSITAANDADGKKMSLLVTLEGNNPGAYSGRPVKLNVHLGGDVLDFIRQNVMFLTDPKSLLQQGQP